MESHRKGRFLLLNVQSDDVVEMQQHNLFKVCLPPPDSECRPTVGLAYSGTVGSLPLCTISRKSKNAKEASRASKRQVVSTSRSSTHTDMRVRQLSAGIHVLSSGIKVG